MASSRLIPISYFSPSQEIRLSAFADTIVYEQEGVENTLRAIRFGGYPEMVGAMSDAVYAGASIEAQVQNRPLRLTSQSKRYNRQLSRDGVYAEATLLALDDEENAKTVSDEEEDQQEAVEQPRKCIIFCPENDKDRLFEELDRKTSVPLIPEFRDYLLEELQKRGILKKLTVLSIRERLDAWVLQCQTGDANIVSVVEDGLRSGAIAIPGQVTDPRGFDSVDTVTKYLNTFGVTVAERIRNQFLPLFDPASEPLSPEVLAINDFIRAHAGYPLYDAQLAVAESVKRQLQKSKCGFIVAECGSGKTKIGATAMAASQGGRKTFNIILCPAHVAKKWARELAETLPDTACVVVNSITEFDRLYAMFERGDKSIYAIISKEKARDGYMKQPAVGWDKLRRAFVCPDCGAIQEMPVSEDGCRYMTKADSLWFRTENSGNHKCKSCGTTLWSAVNPARHTEWVKIGGYGWVHRLRVREHLKNTKNESMLERLRELEAYPDRHYPTLGACRRYPLSTYIKKRYSGRIDGTIVDELHEYSNDSGQGEAMGEIFNASRKVIGMTATLINGYSSGIFHLLYRAVPHLMQKDDKPFTAPRRFDAEYGVVENSYEVKDADYASNRRKKKVKKQTRQLPGVSPLVYSRFLLEHAAFLSLSDMGKELPDYEEIPVPLDMEDTVAEEYRYVESELRKVLKSEKRIAKKILSAYLNLLTIYPDQPYDQSPIVHPETGEPIVEPASIGDFNALGPKEKEVLEIVRRKVANGERVLIYTSWVRTDSQNKLLRLLCENGFRTEILTDKVKTTAREEWVAKRVASGLQVLITNPSLVETGLDLNAFTTLIFYSMGYKLFTLRQASRRSWRINQTAPRVEVYLLYYKNTMQHKAMKLMASKLAVAGIIEGNFTDEGLAAMSDVKDMTSQMAKELMLGIRDNVEDIAASFKKMAILNSDRSKKPIESKPPEAVPTVERLAQTPVVVTQRATPTPERLAELALLAEKQKSEKQKRSKKQAADENQLSLFDFVA